MDNDYYIYIIHKQGDKELVLELLKAISSGDWNVYGDLDELICIWLDNLEFRHLTRLEKQEVLLLHNHFYNIYSLNELNAIIEFTATFQNVFIIQDINPQNADDIEQEEIEKLQIKASNTLKVFHK